MPNIAQVPSHAKASFSSRNPLHIEIEKSKSSNNVASAKGVETLFPPH